MADLHPEPHRSPAPALPAGATGQSRAGAAGFRGIVLFSVGGVAIRIDYSWLLIFVLVLWSLTAGYFPQVHPGYSGWTYALVGLVATLLFFASVLVHELSHAFVANRLGQHVREITLFVFGGMAHLSEESRSPSNEMKVAGIGPLTSIALAVVFWGVALLLEAAQVDRLWTGVFGYLAMINLALAIFNLLPGFPLDGGRLARAWFWYRSGDLRQATARAASWGSGIAIGLMVFGALQIFAGALIGGFWLILIGLFLRGAAAAGYQGMVTEQVLSHVHVADVMVPDPVRIPPDISVAEAIDQYFLRHGFGGFPVGTSRSDGSAGEILGMVSLTQVRSCPPEERAARRVRDIMRALAPDLTITPEAQVATALRRMVEADTGRLLVMQGDRLAGLITRTGISRYLQLSSQLQKLPTEAAPAETRGA